MIVAATMPASSSASTVRNLYTWSNYKNWADQVKGSWEQEPLESKRK